MDPSDFWKKWDKRPYINKFINKNVLFFSKQWKSMLFWLTFIVHTKIVKYYSKYLLFMMHGRKITRVFFFFCPYHESQWGPMWFWIPLALTFITQIKIVKIILFFYYLFCYTEESKSYTTNQYEISKWQQNLQFSLRCLLHSNMFFFHIQ